MRPAAIPGQPWAPRLANRARPQARLETVALLPFRTSTMTCLYRWFMSPFLRRNSDIWSACCSCRASASAIRGRSAASLLKPSVVGICWSSSALSWEAVVAKLVARSTTNAVFCALLSQALSLSLCSSSSPLPSLPSLSLSLSLLTSAGGLRTSLCLLTFCRQP